VLTLSTSTLNETSKGILNRQHTADQKRKVLTHEVRLGGDADAEGNLNTAKSTTETNFGIGDREDLELRTGDELLLTIVRLPTCVPRGETCPTLHP